MRRDSAYWNSLRRQLKPAEAERAFSEMCEKGFLLAVDPHDRAKRIMIWFEDVSTATDHYLYKRDHARTGQGEKKVADFLNDRAARLAWIPLVLENPDVLKFQRYRLLPSGKTAPMSMPTYVYMCRTLQIGLDCEYFIVFIHRRKNQRYAFGTAMIATADYVERSSLICWEDIKKRAR